MRLAYHKDTDSLYIDLSEEVSVESREISEGVVLDYDAGGELVGIDIDNASRKVQLDQLELSGLRGKIKHLASQPPHLPGARSTQLRAIVEVDEYRFHRRGFDSG